MVVLQDFNIPLLKPASIFSSSEPQLPIVQELNSTLAPEKTENNNKKDSLVLDTQKSPSSIPEPVLNNNDPREYCSNSKLGNYVQASRFIPANEIVGVETPISISAYGTRDILPCCLGCYKDIAMSQRCTKCRWPVCDAVCQMSPHHAENECPIFAASRVRPRGQTAEYTGIETLRILLLRDKDPSKWLELQRLEPHTTSRQLCPDGKEVKKFVIHFIQEKCQLKTMFSELEIDFVLGVISVNTFTGFKYVGRHISLLFPTSISFIAHDCNPNLDRKIISTSTTTISKLTTTSLVEKANNNNENDKTQPELKLITSQDEQQQQMDPMSTPPALSFAMQLASSRAIRPGEALTITYVDTELNVQERGSTLSSIFYFYCDCMKCRVDLFNEILMVCDH